MSKDRYWHIIEPLREFKNDRRWNNLPRFFENFKNTSFKVLAKNKIDALATLAGYCRTASERTRMESIQLSRTPYDDGNHDMFRVEIISDTTEEGPSRVDEEGWKLICKWLS